MNNNNSIIRLEQDGVEFFTISATGESGMSQSGLARLCGVKESAIRQLLKSVRTSSCPKSLKCLQGKDFLLAGDVAEYKNVTIINDETCAVLLEWYAFDSQRTNQTALYSYRKFAHIGVRSWIQSITDWHQPSINQQPYWYRRIGLFRERTQIPKGWWCIFEEITSFVWEMESKGYVLPDSAIPDISVGKCWCNYLRSKGVNVANVARSYPHYYPDWAYSVKANIYPLDLLPEFRYWFEDTYKPLKSLQYFRKNHPEALPTICRILGLPEGQ
ncbi:hypothetical protein NG798_27605 [Ancylothrix sp. C2]|uniref:hypothetical protein n=1 Tax=Ancylothrix sp. D3o TaxID=2953691 RepID=UPI0021BBA222|nr:hypothetical protein [Ancylothrix sp. D3o]MCT7953567.1 hypothetical protein [Ancylothrix sp. D3o]